MTTEHKNSRLAHLPAILGGSAALIAALTTVYVNLRHERAPAAEAADAAVQSQPAPAPAPADAVAAGLGAAPAQPAAPRVMRLRLDRVQVDNDGSLGSTDWTFQVSADDKPLFAVPMPSLDDSPGENLARPADAGAASAEVELPAGRNLEISVNGWKKGLLPGTRGEVSGKAWLATGINGTVVTLKSGKPKGAEFVLYFSAAPAD
jgi:hypothetical protein